MSIENANMVPFFIYKIVHPGYVPHQNFEDPNDTFDLHPQYLTFFI